MDGHVDPGIRLHEPVDHALSREGSLVRRGERLLVLGGALTGAASLLHVGIILGGPAWYRFFGAGERMAWLAARGSPYPAVITTGIAIVLGIWALYAFSGAGMIRRLPFTRLALLVIAAIYLGRGILGIPLVLVVDDPYANQLRARMTFMVVTSAVCIVLGLCYAFGAARISRGYASSDA
jgi:putative oxidoreductase